MDLFSEDYQKMAPQMARGIIMNAAFQTLIDDCPNEKILVTLIFEHAAQVILSPQVLRKILGL